MSKKIVERDLTAKILSWMDRPEFIAIKGPRQAGKTTLLNILRGELIKQGVDDSDIEILNFENRSLVEQFQGNPVEFVKSYFQGSSDQRQYLFLDEYQYVKFGGQKLKLVYDALSPQIKIIITGSSSLELTQKTAEFLVGRLLTANLYPFHFGEFLRAKDQRLHYIWKKTSALVHGFVKGEKKQASLSDFTEYNQDLLDFWREYLTYGGYPAVITEPRKEMKKDLLEGLVSTYIDRDIIRLLKVESIEEFRNLIRITASQTGQLVNYNQLADDSRLYYRKVKHFLSILEETYLLKLLRPYHRNLTTELKKNPKIYFLDCGLRNYLINNFSQLDYRQDKGELAESGVLSAFTYSLPENTKLNFWRTAGGAEVDFILNFSEQKIFPVEVKYQNLNRPKTTKAIISFIKSYSPRRMLVLTKGFTGQRVVENTEIVFVPSFWL